MAVLATNYLKVPAGLIPSTLTDFVHKVNLASLTPDFWANVDAAGAYIRVKDSAGSDVPFDLVFIDLANETGLLFFKATLTAGQINEYRIIVDDSLSAPGATDPIGRNAVWSDYDCFFVGSAPSVNRNGAATTQSNLTAGTVSAYGYEPLSVPVSVHQGVAFDGTYFYVTDDNLIRKYDSDWNVIAENASPLTAMRAASGYPLLNHQGDCTIHDGELYIVVERYTNSPYNSQIIAVVNTSDLSFNRHYDISAQLHEVSSICWDATNGYFVVTDFTSAGNSVLHKYSDTGVYLGTISTVSITSKQGIEYYDGHFYISRVAGSLHRLNLDGTGYTLMSASPPATTMEGLCSLGDGSFAVLFDDFPSCLWRAVPTTELADRYPSWLNTLNSAPFRCSGLPKRTTWTMGISAIPMMFAGTAAMQSYSDFSTSDSNRAITGVRSTSVFGMWNSGDSWLDSNQLLNPHPNNIGNRVRLHQLFNGTTARQLWRQGELESTDTGSSQRPAGTGDTMFVGVEDTSLNERFFGLLNFAYIRNGLLSADWLKTEYRSWEQECMFGVSDDAQADVDFAALSATIGTDTDPGVGSTGWTKKPGISDYDTRTRTSTTNPLFGSRFFMGDSSLVAQAYQDISVSGESARIDNGDVLVTLTGSVISDHRAGNVNQDRGFFQLGFYDGDGLLISQVRSRPRATELGTWTDSSILAVVPRGTRSIRRLMEAWRTDGSDLNLGFDIDSLTLSAPALGTPPDPGGRRRNIAMMIG